MYDLHCTSPTCVQSFVYDSVMCVTYDSLPSLSNGFRKSGGLHSGKVVRTVRSPLVSDAAVMKTMLHVLASSF